MLLKLLFFFFSSPDNPFIWESIFSPPLPSLFSLSFFPLLLSEQSCTMYARDSDRRSDGRTPSPSPSPPPPPPSLRPSLPPSVRPSLPPPLALGSKRILITEGSWKRRRRRRRRGGKRPVLSGRSYEQDVRACVCEGGEEEVQCVPEKGRGKKQEEETVFLYMFLDTRTQRRLVGKKESRTKVHTGDPEESNFSRKFYPSKKKKNQPHPILWITQLPS